uniref:C6 domain-containing protein n=1 Tax=Panagrolaimus davidi TaxID=227884 RepID=A0A914Q4M9_9BILA
MASFVVIVVLLSVTSHQIVDGCMPTPNIDDNVMFPLPTTIMPVMPVPCSQCRTALKFVDFCGVKVSACSSNNVININCGPCRVGIRNGDTGPFTMTMMASVDIICSNSGNFYFANENNVVTTIQCR